MFFVHIKEDTELYFSKLLNAMNVTLDVDLPELSVIKISNFSIYVKPTW
jgi:hypothetical protein